MSGSLLAAHAGRTIQLLSKSARPVSVKEAKASGWWGRQFADPDKLIGLLAKPMKVSMGQKVSTKAARDAQRRKELGLPPRHVRDENGDPMQSELNSTTDAIKQSVNKARDNLDKAKEIGDKSEDLRNNAQSFAELARKLRQKQQGGLFGLF